MRCGWLAAFGLAACGGPDLGPPRFSAEMCHRLDIRDADTGKAMAGAEDIAFSPDGAHLWVSAYDRLTNEAGAIWRVPVSALGRQVINAEPVVSGIRPHGIDPGTDHVLAIVRDEGGGAVIRGFYITPDGVLAATPIAAACGVNDLISGWEEILVTLDAQTCQASLKDRFIGAKAGRVERFLGIAHERSVAAQGLALPNGITRQDGIVWVAEMRGRRLTTLKGDRTLALPGAPDNLNSTDEGLVVAVQPSLWRFGLYRYGWVERAPSRVVRVDPDEGEVELLVDDRTGRLFPGATAADLAQGRLVMGSVRGEGLLMCEKAP